MKKLVKSITYIISIMDEIDLKDKEIIYLKEEPDFKTIQKIVEGYFALIPLQNGKMMFVNEEGELKNLKINKEASKIMKCTIYGRVLIIG